MRGRELAEHRNLGPYVQDWALSLPGVSGVGVSSSPRSGGGWGGGDCGEQRGFQVLGPRPIWLAPSWDFLFCLGTVSLQPDSHEMRTQGLCVCVYVCLKG